MYEKYLQQIAVEGKLRNLKERSIHTYQCYVRTFLMRVGKDPEELTCEDIRSFLLSKKEEGLKATTLNLYNSSVRFFYKNVLHILWDDNYVPRMRMDYKVPVVLSRYEVERLLCVTENLMHRAILATMYSSGLRVSEVVHLRYEDVSRTHHQIYVRETKSRSDRYTILSDRNLEILTEYWFACGRPKGILFPSRATGSYLTSNAIEAVMHKAVKKAGITVNATPHSLRHSFATHLMEDGVDYRYIQALLGHRDPRSTEIYLHISNKTLMGIKSPFDRKQDGESNV